MAKTVKVEGRLISVPDDATPDEIDQIARPSPTNPSDSIPKAKPPVPTELQGPAPSRFKQVMTNLPGSAMEAGKRLLQGPMMGGVSRDSQGNIDMNAGLHPLIDSFKQGSFKPLLDAATEDPVGAYQNVVGAAKGGKDIGENTAAVPMMKGAMTGGARAAMEPVNPTGVGRILPFPIPKTILGGMEGGAIGRYFGHPEIGAAIGASAPVVRGAYRGAQDAAREFKTNVLGDKELPDPGDMPNAGKVKSQMLSKTPASRPVQSRGNNNVVGGDPGDLPPSAANDASTDIPGGQNSNVGSLKKQMMKRVTGIGKDTRGSVNLGRFGGSGSGEPAEMPNAATETRPVASPSTAGTQGAEPPTNAPSTFSSSGVNPTEVIPRSRAVATRPQLGGEMSPESHPNDPRPTPPPGSRWITDRGAMPGEPSHFLDGGPDDAKAAITENDTPKGLTWEAHAIDHNGEPQSLGEFTSHEDAARVAEQHVDAQKKIIDVPKDQIRPVKRVIYDENNNPVAYDDPNNPYSGAGKIREVTSPSNAYSDNGEGMQPGTEAPDHNMPQEEARTPKSLPTAADLHEQRTDAFRPKDVHDEIAMEGLQKRASDSRAKYEDVYQNVIKGQYTPEELRNMTPEQQTAIDLKIKNMKHETTGKKKYGSGLNPAVTESLAQRLEAETQ